MEEQRQGLWQGRGRDETSSSLTLPSSSTLPCSSTLPSSSSTLPSSRCPVQLISTITIYESQVSSLSKMRQGRLSPTLVASQGSQGKLYAIGGCASNFTPLGSVEVYDLATNQLTEANPMVVAS